MGSSRFSLFSSRCRLDSILYISSPIPCSLHRLATISPVPRSFTFAFTLFFLSFFTSSFLYLFSLPSQGSVNLVRRPPMRLQPLHPVPKRISPSRSRLIPRFSTPRFDTRHTGSRVRSCRTSGVSRRRGAAPGTNSVMLRFRCLIDRGICKRVDVSADCVSEA